MFGQYKKVLQLARLVFDQIISKRHIAQLIVLPNCGDRDLSWTMQNPCSVEMSCDLVRSASICHALSGPFAHK